MCCIFYTAEFVAIVDNGCCVRPLHEVLAVHIQLGKRACIVTIRERTAGRGIDIRAEDSCSSADTTSDSTCIGTIGYLNGGSRTLTGSHKGCRSTVRSSCSYRGFVHAILEYNGVAASHCSGKGTNNMVSHERTSAVENKVLNNSATIKTAKETSLVVAAGIYITIQYTMTLSIECAHVRTAKISNWCIVYSLITIDIGCQLSIE